ncbi:MAG: ABC transporter substrate-binding protein, partial [Desulfobacterota bacterium]|nr:ABC transporter substrate-binding protein [Thermodesulfobacteriota bacterium]
MGRRISVALVAGVLAAFLTAGMAGASTIKLGAHAPQSGSLAKHGIEQIKGIRLAAEDFEKKAKVKVELIVYDDESNPQKA